MKQNKISCSICSLEGSSKYEEVVHVSLPAYNGEITILPGHAEMFVELTSGEIKLKNDRSEIINIDGGVAHIRKNKLTVLG